MASVCFSTPRAFQLCSRLIQPDFIGCPCAKSLPGKVTGFNKLSLSDGVQKQTDLYSKHLFLSLVWESWEAPRLWFSSLATDVGHWESANTSIFPSGDSSWRISHSWNRSDGRKVKAFLCWPPSLPGLCRLVESPFWSVNPFLGTMLPRHSLCS